LTSPQAIRIYFPSENPKIVPIFGGGSKPPPYNKRCDKLKFEAFTGRVYKINVDLSTFYENSTAGREKKQL
jgi:hypothetical protein